MGTSSFIVTPANRRQPLNVIGASVTVLGTQTQLSDKQITVQSGAEGVGPPPHSHGWDESFYVTKGAVQFSCGGREEICGPGAFVHVPAGTVHAFSFGPGGGEMLEITGPGSNAVAMFEAVDRDVPPGPPDVMRVVRTLADHGVTVQGAQPA